VYRSVNKQRLRKIWRFHAYIIATAVFTVGVGVFSISLKPMQATLRELGISDSFAVELIIPFLLATAFLTIQGQRERRRRVQHEWNLVRSNLQLRHGAAELERLALIDSLTGIDNRRGWYDKLDREWLHAQRYGHGPAVIMLDLDHFKTVNDKFGHDAGDQLLRSVAEVLATALRDTDSLGRLGGDEFAVLLPETTAGDALVVAERMQELLKGARPQLLASGSATTFSAGIASGQSQAAADAEELLKMADAALYDAKASGRNCIVVAGRPRDARDLLEARHDHEVSA
jgi:diguanylate cyclase (GGDEF)-like protein